MRAVPVLASLAALGSWQLAFGAFFPNAQGTLGHDYALQLPKLLAGYFWAVENGWAVPWYTPAFCGGVPLLADPQSIYYSVPQALLLVVDPQTAVALAALIFAGLGQIGCYALLRAGFGASPPAAFLGSVLFLFNGFYGYRMAIGHLAFHGYMLLPSVAWLCMRPAAGARESGLDGAAAGALLGYVFLSGGVHILPVMVTAVVALAVLRVAISGPGGARLFALRFGLAGCVAACLSAFKLVPAMAYLSHFPRDAYRLPGAEDFGAAVWSAFVGLFLQRELGVSAPAWTNVQWKLGPIAFEHGVGLVPLGVGVVALGTIGYRLIRRRRSARPHGSAWQLGAWAALVGLLILPLVLNTYQSGWNAILKRLPLLRNSSMLVHWFALYIPLVAVGSALAFDFVSCGRDRLRTLLSGGLALAVVASHLLLPHAWLHEESYSPSDIVYAWKNVEAGRGVPAVHEVVAWDVAAMNDALTAGASQMRCREPMFGYKLEWFPQGPLRAGPATPTRGGFFNLKNPSCYVYPEENGCRPGDHFRAEDSAAVERFRSYRTFPSAAPRRQGWASRISFVGLGISFVAVIGALVRPSRRVGREVAVRHDRS